MRKLLTILLFPLQLFATNYYISNSGSDAASGTSTGTAWASITKLNASWASINAGDNILFQRGGTFYGSINVGSSGTIGNVITFADYGAGAKPKLFGSVRENTAGQWTNISGNLWRNNDGLLTTDVGNIVFNGEAFCGVKLMTATPTYTTQGQFWYDFVNHWVVVYSVGNPGTFYTDIQCVPKTDAVNTLTGKSYLTFQNFDFRYYGVCVWEIGGNFLTWQDLNISYIGGCDQFNNYAGRYGNALQMWQGITDITIQRCVIDNIYDSGITPQGYNGTYNTNNLFIRNNTISNCEYSFEFYERPATSTTTNVYFEYNTCINAGSGWSHAQRPSVNGCHMRIALFTGVKSNIFIRNNIFSGATEEISYCINATDYANMVVDYNDLYQSSGNIGRINGTATNYASLATWQTATSQEVHSINSNPLFVSGTDFHLTNPSPCRNIALNSELGIDLGAYQFANLGGNFNMNFH